MTNDLNINENLTQKAKEQIWTHLVSIIGWLVFIVLVIGIKGILEDEGFADLATLTMIMGLNIISLIIMPTAYLCFNAWKIKWGFLLKNPFYNFFWYFGIITIIVSNIIFILTILIIFISNLLTVFLSA